MSHEYIIRLDVDDPLPELAQLHDILSQVPGYFAQVQYPNDIALEFRGPDNQDAQKMPDLSVISQGRDINICANNALFLHAVMSALIIEFVDASKAEHVEVLRA